MEKKANSISLFKETEFVRKITIEDPILYCCEDEDLDTLLLKELNNIFKGKCFKNCFIIEIIKILERTNIIIEQYDVTGNGYINCRFIAKIFDILKTGDIIPICNVNKILNDKILLCPSLDNNLYADEFKKLDNITNNIEQIRIGLLKNEKLNFLKVGDKIPVQIDNILYQVGENILIFASIPKRYLPIKIRNEHKEFLLNEYKDLLDEIKNSKYNNKLYKDDVKFIPGDETFYFGGEIIINTKCDSDYLDISVISDKKVIKDIIEKQIIVFNILNNYENKKYIDLPFWNIIN